MRDAVISILTRGFDRDSKPSTIGGEFEFLPIDRCTGHARNTEEILRALIIQKDVIGNYKGARLKAIQIHRDGIPHEEISEEVGTGMIEIATSVCNDLFELDKKAEYLVHRMLSAAQSIGIDISTSGIHPVAIPSKKMVVRGKRYQMLLDRFGEGPVRNTIIASTQTHVSITQTEMLPAMNVMNALSCVLIALAANSPIWQSQIDPKGRTAVRVAFWDEFGAPNRVGFPPHPFYDVNDYADFILNSELTCVPIDDELATKGLSLAEYLNKRRLSLSSLQRILYTHLKNFWYDVRIRPQFGTLEVRPCCQQPTRQGSIAFSALSLGMVQNWRQLLNEVVSKFRWEQWREFRKQAIKNNINASLLVSGRLIPIKDIVKKVVDIANNGLIQREKGEESFLEPVHKRLEGSEEIPANQQIKIFRKYGIRGLLDTCCLQSSSDTT